MASCDECGDPNIPTYGKNTFTIYNGERTFPLPPANGLGSADYGRLNPTGLIQTSQPPPELGANFSLSFHAFQQGPSESKVNVVCSSSDQPWLTQKNPCQRIPKAQVDYVTEYMHQFRRWCPNFQYNLKRRTQRIETTTIPIEFRPAWNKSMKVQRKPYEENIDAQEAKLRLLDGILGDEMDPEDLMVLYLARQETKEQYRREVGACGCPGATFRFHEPGIQKTKLIRTRAKENIFDPCADLPSTPPDAPSSSSSKEENVAPKLQKPRHQAQRNKLKPAKANLTNKSSGGNPIGTSQTKNVQTSGNNPSQRNVPLAQTRAGAVTSQTKPNTNVAYNKSKEIGQYKQPNISNKQSRETPGNMQQAKPIGVNAMGSNQVKSKEAVGNKSKEAAVGNKSKEAVGNKSREIVKNKSKEAAGNKSREVVNNKSKEAAGNKSREAVGNKSTKENLAYVPPKQPNATKHTQIKNISNKSSAKGIQSKGAVINNSNSKSKESLGKNKKK